MEAALMHPLFSTMTFVGIVVASVLTLAFWLVSRSRAKVLRDLRYSPPRDFSNLPGLSIVMPCKGLHENSLSNWNAQTGTVYPGPVEFIFVTESKEDPAYEAALKFQREFHKPSRSVRVEVAGLSWHNSQKIHNMLEGMAVASPDSKYVMCLDDDIKMYRDSLATLVSALEDDKEVFAATGYSFEIPLPGSSFVNYLIMSYRLILLGAFFTDHPFFLWGGCMVLRHDDIRNNAYGIVDAWRDGGYSEDFLAVSILKQVNRKIAFPFTCIFPNILRGSRSFSNYWNFVCRQLYVLVTYCSTFNKVHNFFLMVVQFLIPVAIYLPLFITPARALFMFAFGWRHGFSTILDVPAYSTPLLLGTLYLVMLVVMLAAVNQMVRTLSRLCTVLGDKDPVDSNIGVLKTCAAFVTHCLIIPAITLYAYSLNKIVWAGTTYHHMAGKVGKMERIDADGNLYSLDTFESLETAVRKDAASGFLSRSSWAYQPEAASTIAVADEEPAVAVAATPAAIPVPAPLPADAFVTPMPAVTPARGRRTASLTGASAAGAGAAGASVQPSPAPTPRRSVRVQSPSGRSARKPAKQAL